MYLFSGFFTVGNNEVAVRLRFGRIVEQGEGKQIQSAGLKFAFPYPIEQVIKINKGLRQVELNDEFMFEIPENLRGKTLEEMAPQIAAQPLDPTKSGYVVTGDANIMHARFRVRYHIEDAERFVTYIGEDKLAEDLVRAASQQAIVLAAATATSDAIYQGSFPTDRALREAQATLDKMKTGVVIDTIEMPERTVPMAIRSAYQQVTDAEQDRGKLLDAAHQERDRILGAVAGFGHRPLSELISRYELAIASGDREAATAIDARLNWMLTTLNAPMWAGEKLPPEAEARAWELVCLTVNNPSGEQAAAAQAELNALLTEAGVPLDRRATQPITGQVAEQISRATSDRQSELERVRTRGEEFRKYHEQYSQNPGMREIIMARLWQQAKQEILTGDVEVFYVSPGQLRLELNRDPDIKKEREREGIRKRDEAMRAAQSTVRTETGPPSPGGPPPGGPPPGGDAH
jgi:membrane protease subunit HflK